MTREEAISRQAVLEMAYDMSEIDGEHFTKPWMVVDVEDIQKLPSVKPQEPKTGHWIDHHLPEVGKCMQYMSECSVCGKMICKRLRTGERLCGLWIKTYRGRKRKFVKADRKELCELQT